MCDPCGTGQATLTRDHSSLPPPLSHPILVVDNDESNLTTMTYVLDDVVDVETASSGEEALRLLAQKPFSVLLCDQRMPGMSGVDVCVRARSVAPHTVRIIITAYADMQAVLDAINDGAVSRYLTKPFERDELVSSIREEIKNYGTAQRVREAGSTLLDEGLSLAARTAEAEIAHDVNNMIAPVILLLQTVQGELSDARHDMNDRALSSMADGLDEAAGALAVLQSFVLRLRDGNGKLRAGKSEMGRTVDSTIHMFEPRVDPAADMTVHLVCESIVPLDPSGLTQVFVNLLVNALQAAEAAGRRGQIEVIVDRHKDMARLCVRDDGGGISAEVLPRIFDGRFTTRDTGTGRGLAIARRLVDSAGGTIQATNQEDGWTEFTVLLPISGE